MLGLVKINVGISPSGTLIPFSITVSGRRRLNLGFRIQILESPVVNYFYNTSVTLLEIWGTYKKERVFPATEPQFLHLAKLL